MLSERIKKLRLNFGISQVELGNILGVSKQCVSNWENDNVMPSIEMLIKIALYFNVSTDYLLGLESTQALDITGLTDVQITHIKYLISDLRKK